jgi:predicted dienelactone hydrolase
MGCLALWPILIAASVAALNVACAGETIFKVGVTTRDLVPAEPYDWRGAHTHALRAMIWYPAAANAREEPQWIGPPILPFFSAANAARDADPAAGPRRPLILLSHGFGGTATDLAWLGAALAAHGFGTCTAVGRVFIRAACVDPDGADRDAIHAETARLALDFFTANLR